MAFDTFQLALKALMLSRNLLTLRDIQALICNAVLFFIIAKLDFMPTTCPPLVLQLKGLRNCVSSCFSQPTLICGQGIRQQHF